MQEGGDSPQGAESSEEEEDSQGTMTRLQSTVEAGQVCN